MNDFLTENEQQGRTRVWGHDFHVAPYPLEPGEAYMNASQQQYFKNNLLAWKENVQKRLTDIRRHLQIDTLPEAAFKDQASIEIELSSDIQLQNYYQTLIGKIDNAIQRINDKEYGFCENCEQAIGVRRLEALPLATTCIVCQQLKEKSHKC